jgi:hypothetical protein
MVLVLSWWQIQQYRMVETGISRECNTHAIDTKVISPLNTIYVAYASFPESA